MPLRAATLAGKILIVDDQPANVMLLERVLRAAGYQHVSSTTDPREVCALYLEHHYDVVLLDLHMPVMDGFEVMAALTKIHTGGYLPVIVVTAQPGHKLRALEAGARDFISKPFEVAEVLARVQNTIEVRLLHEALRDQNRLLEERVRDKTADIHQSHLETIYTLTRAAERKDDDTGAHVQRISYYCREMARLLGQDASFVDAIFLASPMHDVGKIGIPDAILRKPGGFAREEWQIMQGHAAFGAEILGDSKSPYVKIGAEIALCHHERWNGGGYPNGLVGEAIPLTARIMNVCDVYDALRSRRPYKPPMEHATAVDIMVRGDGRTAPEHFDPEILAKFAQSHRVFCDIYDGYTGEGGVPFPVEVVTDARASSTG